MGERLNIQLSCPVPNIHSTEVRPSNIWGRTAHVLNVLRAQPASVEELSVKSVECTQAALSVLDNKKRIICFLKF